MLCIVAALKHWDLGWSSSGVSLLQHACRSLRDAHCRNLEVPFRQCKAQPKDYVDYIDSSVSQPPESEDDDSDFGTLYSRRPPARSSKRRSSKGGGGGKRSGGRQGASGSSGDEAAGVSGGDDSVPEDEAQPKAKQVELPSPSESGCQMHALSS